MKEDTDTYILETVTKPFKISKKMQTALEYLNAGDPTDVAAEKAGLSVRYFRDMFTMYNRHEIKITEEEKQIKIVKRVLRICKSKNMIQAEACALIGVDYSSFQRWYFKYRKKVK